MVGHRQAIRRNPLNDLFGYLAGQWRIDRRIGDRRAGPMGRLTGTAVFMPAPGGLDYAENGLLRLGEFEGSAVQHYRYLFDTPALANIQFEDGRAFHALDLTTDRADVAHDCPPDAYTGRYRIIGKDRWVLSWVIHGPRKHLRIGTRYRRL